MKTWTEAARFIAEQPMGFIASIDEDGFPNMKAMLAPRKIEDGRIYFSTNTSSMRVAQYIENAKASVYFYHGFEGVMLIGTMEALTDDAVKREIWRAGDTEYYKEGVTDPDYCVLRFTALKGRHYRDLHTEAFEL